MSNEFLRSLMSEQRRRLVGSVLEHAENNLYQRMSSEEQRAFREKVLTSVGVFYDFMLDAVKASVNDGSVMNEEALVLLRDLHALSLKEKVS